MSAIIKLSVRISEARVAATMRAMDVSRAKAIALLRDAYDVALGRALDERVLMAQDGRVWFEPEEQVKWTERGGAKRVEEHQ